MSTIISICDFSATSGGANTKLDCDDPFPNNEPDIEVNPGAPGHMIASSNDYGSCCDQFYTTLDNSATWTTGNMSINNPQQTVAFIQNGLSFSVRKLNGDSGSASLKQCASNASDTFADASKTDKYCYTGRLRFDEGFATAWKTRFAVSGPGPGYTTADYQNFPGVIYNVSESGFWSAGVSNWPIELGEPAGMAKQGTRLRVVFNNFPTDGSIRLFVSLNNAGFTWDAVVHKMTDEQWETMLAVHLTAPFRIIRAAAPYFREAAKKEKAGGKVVNRKIINVSSLAGMRGNSGQTNYAAAKAGVGAEKDKKAPHRPKAKIIEVRSQKVQTKTINILKD